MTRTVYATAQPVPALRPGNYYAASSPMASVSSASLGVGTLRAAPTVFPRAVSLARIAAEIVTAGDVGSKVRLGIYADDETGRPGALLVDAGQINGDSATAQELTISLTLAPGAYWFAAVIQSVTTTQPAVRSISAWHPPIPISIGTSLATAQTVLGFSTTGITGALPATFPPGMTAAGAAPRLLYRVA